MMHEMSMQKNLKLGQDDAPTDFESVFRSAPGLYLLLLPDAPKYTIVDANAAYMEATLTKIESLKGRGLFEAFPDNPDDVNATGVKNLSASLGHVIKELKAHKMQIQKYDVPRPPEKGGGFEEKFWSPSNTPVLDDDGKIQYIIHRVKDVTAEMRIEQQRDRFFALSSDMLSIAGFDGCFKQINPAWALALGWEEDEIVGKPWLDLVHPEDKAATIEAGIKAISGTEILKFENRYRCKDGSYRWLSWKAKPYMEEQLLYCSADDITNRKNDELKIAESEIRFRGLANAMPQVVWTARPDGNLNYVNERCYEYSGTVHIDGEDLVDWVAIVHPDDLPNTVQVWTDCIANGKPYEVFQRIFHAQSGKYRWNLTRALPVRGDDGKISIWYGTNTDIEDQRRVEETLRKSEKFNASILDSTTDCIKVLDLQGNLLSLNKGGCEQMEIDDVSICLNQPWYEFWNGEERSKAQKEFKKALNGQSGRFDAFCPTMKGTPKWWEVIVSPIFGADNQVVNVLSVSRNITDRKKLETEMQEAKDRAETANLAKTEFLANMSHEIRTPMNAVIGLSTIIAKSEGLTPKQKDYVRTLQLSADALLSLINDLLDISKIEARSIELEHIPFSLTQMLNEIISMMSLRANEKGLEFKAEGESNIHHMLYGDPSRLRQIILNLCSNAIKFTEKGGVYITVTCAPSDIPGVENVAISIKDTGIGIAQSQQENIFEKFIQADSSINRKYGGTGLGLAITKTLTEIMDGKITLESEVGVGSTFTVMLPLMTAENKALSALATPQIDNNTKVLQPENRVLLVEDYAPNVIVAGAFLEDFGYSYDVSENGYDAVEKTKTGDYVAILMDVQMHGINGFETTRQIRANEKENGKPRTPIIGMTAHALSGDKERCIAAEMDDYLSKPYNSKELEQKLARCTAAKKNTTRYEDN